MEGGALLHMPPNHPHAVRGRLLPAFYMVAADGTISIYAVGANLIWAFLGYHADGPMVQIAALWPLPAGAPDVESLEQHARDAGHRKAVRGATEQHPCGE